MRQLVALGFIKATEGASGEFNYVLLLNPYLVIERLKSEGRSGFQSKKYVALIQRAIEIGAKDAQRVAVS